jgi:hypothetical protein
MYEPKQHLKEPHEKFIFTVKKSVLNEELMKDLRSYYDNSPRSAHLGKRQEGENKHFPSCRIEVTDKRSKKLGLGKLRTLILNAILKQNVFKELGWGEDVRCLFKRFTIRRYDPLKTEHDRDSCAYHIDGCDISFVFFLGGGGFEGGNLIFGKGDDKISMPGTMQEAGTMLVFEGCKVEHTVLPITGGQRYSIVLFCDKRVNRSKKRKR